MVVSNRETHALEDLGLSVHGRAGPEWCCDCPACGKESHLHFNPEKRVGHCKVCDFSGTHIDIAAKIVESEWDRPTGEHLERLTEWRGLEPHVIAGSPLGFRDGQCALVSRDKAGWPRDVRRCSIDDKWMSFPGAKVTLFGAEQLADKGRGDHFVYLCEGEWDAIALDGALTDANRPGVVLASPGAGTFKQEWGDWCAGRRVIVLYDNDDAGAAGEQRVAKVLRRTARSVQFHVWDKDLPNKYDISNLI
ncbi:MAG: toprim domain-containing protein [Planctomycetota bacterium]